MLKIFLLFSDQEQDLADKLTGIGRQFGINTSMVGIDQIDLKDKPNLVVVSDSLPADPYEVINYLNQNQIQSYYLSKQSGLSVFFRVKQNGGLGIIPYETAIDDFSNLVSKLAGINNHKQRVNSGNRQPLRQVVRENSVTAGINESAINPNPMSQGPPFNTNKSKLFMANSNPSPYKLNKEIIVIYGFKGGVGKTTTSCNLAIELASLSQPKLSVVLVDFDINAAGRVVDTLNIAPTTTILDWVATKYVDDVSNYLIDGPGGIKVLPAPRLPHDERAVTAEVAEKVLQTLSRRFDVVIVDTPMILRDSTVIALEMATSIYLLGIPDRPTLKGVHQLTKTLSNLNIDTAKVKFVMNMVQKRSGMRVDDLKEVIPYQFVASVPYDPIVQSSVNRCDLPALDRKSKNFLGGLQKIVNDIVPSYKVEPTGSSFSLSKFIPFFGRR